MAKPKKAGVERKKKTENLPVKDVQTGKARTVTGGAVTYSEFTIKKVTDKASPTLF